MSAAVGRFLFRFISLPPFDSLGFVALTIVDRERILWALDDARTDALAELRGVLLSEDQWRARDGLV